MQFFKPRWRKPRLQFCPTCGARIRVPKSKFCNACGARIAISSRTGSPTNLLVFDKKVEPTSKSQPFLSSKRESENEEITERSFSEIKKEVESNGIEFEELPETVQTLLANRGYYVVKYNLQDEQAGEHGGELSESTLDPRLIDSLRSQGKSRLFGFQERAIDAILRGQHTVIVAPTGNGKTLAFALPIFHRILQQKNRSSRPSTLIIYPTKALARDQLKALRDILPEIKISVFDGDTVPDERRTIIDSPPEILISNFDTVEWHLRNHTRFSEILGRISCLVVDEIHKYVGAFGSHAYFILKRLKRINQNQTLQIIGASATVRNPLEFARLLFDDDAVAEIKCETGRRGRIHFLMLYPSKSSTTNLIANSARFILAAGMKTLVFANTHKDAEVLNLALRQNGIRSDLHRAGLPRNQRLNIEESFKSGELKVSRGYPYSRAWDRHRRHRFSNLANHKDYDFDPEDRESRKDGTGNYRDSCAEKGRPD